MGNLLILGIFFLGLIELIVLLAIINDLQSIREDLYYYLHKEPVGEDNVID